ncbi:hypothetical protein [Corallococcus llansteffanensis]|uniref:Uncharacterized protein n=1 Tax=Corallococcus llansteffanensis TaxID=2316731 RepID=A0A3A8QB74_9BACT|nr:hypothetical protein [Corallococcus llansteffanensis]RKH65959.1 hypothetical protein D7V93_05100 [Corallococcus llansteffanensis]
MQVRHAAIGASHEIYDSGEAAMRAAVARRVEDRLARRRQQRQPARYRRWKEVETTPLLRSMDGGLDDTKFLYPVLDNLPVIVFPLLSHALTGVQVSVYGPPEVCRVVEVVRDVLLAQGHIDDRAKLLAIEEDRTDISLSRSFQRSTECLSAGSDEPIAWSAGDLVLAYDTHPWLMDRHLPSYELIFNLNARQRVFPEGMPELFGRNYFDRMRLEGEPGAILDIKEPNVLLFTAAGLRGLTKMDELRQPRPGDTYMKVLLRAAARTVWHTSPAATVAFLRYGFKRTRDRIEAGDALPRQHAVELARTFFGVSTLIKAENTDPFCVRDGDSVEDLFGYYQAVLQPIVDSGATKEAGYRELARYHPHAELLYQLSQALRPLQAELPLWRRWPELIQDKLATLNQRLTAEFRGLGIDDAARPVPEYFDAKGVFQSHPAPSDNILQTRDFLRHTYLASFERNQLQYRWLVGGRFPPARRRVSG